MRKNYLTKFPISVRQKRHTRDNSITGVTRHHKEEMCFDFKSRYGYFSVDRKNNIVFLIHLVDRKRKKNIIIKIAKQYIYDSLLLSLLYRPIRRDVSRNEKIHVRKNIKTLQDEKIMNDLTIGEIRERFLTVKNELAGFIDDSPTETKQRTAELQMERLLEQEWKIKLLSNISQSEQTIKKLKIQ